MDKIELKLDGYTDLPNGKIAAIVTNLDMLARPAWLDDYRMPPGFEVRPIGKPDPARYRALYAAVGSEWLWFSRAVMDEQRLTSVLHHPDNEVHVARFNGEDIGFAELDFRHRPSCEISYFGLIPAAAGKGFGRALIAHALKAAWRQGVERVWIHTCTLDSPSGLALYRKVGFVPFRYQVEVADDPRLTGEVPREAGPLVPIIA